MWGSSLSDFHRLLATKPVCSETSKAERGRLVSAMALSGTRGPYVHPAAEEKRKAMHKFEKFRANAVIAAEAAQRSHWVTTKVATVERVN
jgi:hypothetical protein